MDSVEEELLVEVAGFRLWAATIPMARQVMEWEVDYPGWGRVCNTASALVAAMNIEDMAQETLSGLLFIIAADSWCGRMAAEVAAYPDQLLRLAQAAIDSSYGNAKWQLAVELGKLDMRKSEAERILFILAKDEDEYTRRRVLGALAEIKSPLVNELIEPAWSSNHQYQRMMVLSVLQRISSPELEKYLALAEADGREYLVYLAARIRRGEID